MAVSSDGKTVAIADREKRVFLWNVDQPATLRKLPLEKRTYGSYGSLWSLHRPQSLAFSADGNKLLVANDTVVQLFDVATFKELLPFEGHLSEINHLAFLENGKQLVTGRGEVSRYEFFDVAEAITWSVGSGKQFKFSSLLKPAWPNIGETSPEHAYYVGSDRTNGLQLFDMASGKLLGRSVAPGNQEKFGPGYFSAGGKFFVVHFEDASGKDTMRLFSVPSCKLLCELPPMAYATTYLRSSIYPLDRLYVPAIAFTTELVAFINGKEGRINVVKIGSGQVQRVSTGQPGTLNDLPVVAFHFDINFSLSPDNKSLASWSSEDKVVRIWDLATAKERMQIVANDLRELPIALAWSPDSRTLAIAGLAEPGKVQLWEVASRKIRRELAGHDGRIRALAYSPDGRWLASGIADTTALVWDVWKW